MELVKQEFSGPVNDVAGRDVVNHHHTHGRPLSKSERSDLNKLVQRLESEFGELTWQTWKFLHRTMGIDNIEGMCLGHLAQADAILNLLLDRATLKKALETKSSQNSELAQLRTRSAELDAKLKYAQQEYQSSEARAAAYAKQVGNCPGCNAAAGNSRKARRLLLLTRAVAGIAISASMILGYLLAAKPTSAQAIEARNAVCEFEGKPYTIGSIIDNPTAPDLECVVENGLPPQWKIIKSAVVKKSSRPKRAPPSQKKEELTNE